MTAFGRVKRHLASLLPALVLAFGLALPVLAQETADPGAAVSGGAAPGQPTVKVHADSSGALVPETVRPPTSPTVKDAESAPASGGFAPQGGVKPKPIASGGSSGAALDYQGWERMATRAESALLNTSLSDQALENLRLELTRWREQLTGAQNANATRISTLKDQIDALGPVPADGTAEAPEIATRRAELTAQMGRLQAPGIAADEAYRRADGLIREIDRILRERQADELLKLWPNPLYPGNWSDALAALTSTAMTLWGETAQRAADPVLRRKLADNLPLILPLLVFAIGALWRGRRWTDRVLTFLRGPSSARGRRIWEFLASLGVVLVPVLGFAALGEAMSLSMMLGPMGQKIAASLGQIGLTLFVAVWLGMRVFPAEEVPGALLILSPERRAEGRFLTSSFGVLLAVAMLRRIAMSEIEASDAATSVLTLPIVLIGAVLLVRLGHLMRRAERGEGDEGRANYRATLVSILARGVLLFGIVAPVLAAVGYISAAQALIFPSVMTLALAAVLYLMQRMVGDIYALVMRSDAEQDALAPVLISFALSLAMLPVLALIWGARVADLTELWTRFQEGFQLGETRISPTDFLFFAVVFAIGLSLTRLFQGALKNSILPRTSLDQGGQNAVVSGLGYLGIIVSALVAINSTGINLSGLAIVAGALSVGIGFGLQNIVSNFVSGIILLIERPVSEGDWIEVGPVQGIVKSISVRSTRIQTFDRADVIVPNSDLISGRVTNWTRFSLTGRLVVPVSVPYNSDSERVRTVLQEIAEAQPLALMSPPPQVMLMGFGPETMNFEIRMILRDVNFSLDVRHAVNMAIVKRFDEEGIVFSYAHRYYQKQEDADRLDAETRAKDAAEIAALLGQEASLEGQRRPVVTASPEDPR